jgi:hypothetical protein
MLGNRASVGTHARLSADSGLSLTESDVKVAAALLWSLSLDRLGPPDVAQRASSHAVTQEPRKQLRSMASLGEVSVIRLCGGRSAPTHVTRLAVPLHLCLHKQPVVQHPAPAQVSRNHLLDGPSSQCPDRPCIARPNAHPASWCVPESEIRSIRPPLSGCPSRSLLVKNGAREWSTCTEQEGNASCWSDSQHDISRTSTSCSR